MSRAAIRHASPLAAALAIALLGAPSLTSAAPPSTAIVARIPFGDPVPGPILDGTFAFGSVWASTGNDEITRIDPATNAITARVTVGAGFRHELAGGAGALWATNPDEDTVSRIDPATNQVTGTFSSGGALPVGVATTPGAVWVSNHHADESGQGSVVRLDPDSGAIVATIPLGAATFAGGPGGMVAAAGSVWVGVPNLGAIARIDPATNAVSALVPYDQPCGIPTAVGPSVFMTGPCGQPSIARVNTASNAVTKLNAGGRPWFAAGANGLLWVSVTSSSCPPNCPPSSSGLSRVDLVTGKVLGKLSLDGSGFVAAGAGSIWVGVGEAGEVLRIQP